MKLNKHDIILLCVLLFIGFAAFVSMLLFRHKGSFVEITKGGELVARYSLNEDTVLLIGDELQGNNLVIKDGAAWVDSATCPDKICMKRGKIQYDGQSIICLPNKTVITVRSDKLPPADVVQ